MNIYLLLATEFTLLWTGFAQASAITNNPKMQNATVSVVIPSTPGNPRNTEGSFITLRDGRILFAYSRFLNAADDHNEAIIAGRFSRDGGNTWDSSDITLVAKEGAMNVMSASLLRLKDSRIALFYLRKNSVDDCRPYVRFSSDEAKTWSEPNLAVPDPGYFVLNNDRVIQLRSGRIVFPVAHHIPVNGKFNLRGIVLAYYSDDTGKSWHASTTKLECPIMDRAGLQEPGVVELRDGKLMLFMRTALGTQYLSFSSDKGTTWSAAQPSSIQSPLSPASIRRIPSTGDLLMVWNDHSTIDAKFRVSEAGEKLLFGKRTPLTVALSKDNGKTWIHAQDLLDDPNGWYCYTAIHFVGNRVLLGFGYEEQGPTRLGTMVSSFRVSELYRN